MIDEASYFVAIPVSTSVRVTRARRIIVEVKKIGRGGRE